MNIKNFSPSILISLACFSLISFGEQGQHIESAIQGEARTTGSISLPCRSAIDKLKAAGYVIPACPRSGAGMTDASNVLTAQFPASAIFIKPYQPGQYLDALDMIRAAKTAKLPIVINVMGSFQTKFKEAIAREMPEILLSEEGKVVQLGSGLPRTAVNLVSDPGTSSTFLHDFGKQLVDVSGGWKFFSTQHSGNAKSESGTTPFGEFLKQTCGVSVIAPPPGSKDATSSKAGYGGNFLPLAPNHVLTGGRKVGEKYTAVDVNHKAHLDKLSEFGIGHSIVDTSFLKVGHVDEIIAPIPVKRSPPCDVGYVVANTELGWEQVVGEGRATEEKTGSLPSFDLIPLAYAGRSVIGKRPHSPVNCKHLTLHTLEKASLFEAGFISEESLHQAIFFDTAFIREIATLESEGRYQEDKINFPIYRSLMSSKPPKYRELFQQIADRYCVGFSGIDKKTFEHYGAADERLRKLQVLNTKTIPALMGENIKRLKETIAQKNGCQDPTIIRVPVLFENFEGKAVSVLPNSVNLVSVGINNDKGQLLVPKTTSSNMDTKIRAALEKHGVQPHFSSSTSCHLLDGDHSCSTSVFRLCSQE